MSKNINSSIYKLFNGNYKNGCDWITEIENMNDREAQVEYFSEKFESETKNNNKQLEIDYWFFNQV